jgi:hypothetical protein
MSPCCARVNGSLHRRKLEQEEQMSSCCVIAIGKKRAHVILLCKSQWNKMSTWYHAAREPMEQEHMSSCCVRVNASLRWNKLEQEEHM